ncbi:putative peptidoglycan lipid II flippase [Angulomicrobium tetraedrale]|uniref:Putative peptidoglycan lipid II flippase n=1 Tax=Ancylobacter tetraedralis TaxID=217068 RepID=A0A839Z522_9HYPH|nr:lipid II flippase MurJ [Ancylobacter tetraedralis]MBB3770729.1 putative peptidoglycan lipid II flippase [Ancylobacter tetraedralis]
MALLRHASTVALLTLASRVLGFARDAGVAALFGTGLVADACVAGLALPQLARRLLGEGALNAAILPHLGGPAGPRGSAQTRARAAAAVVLFALAAMGLAVLLYLLMPAVIALLAPGFPGEGPRAEGAVFAGRLTVICLPLAMLAGVFAALANAAGRFARPSLAPAAANVVVLALLVALYLAGAHAMSPALAIAWLAGGAVAGAATQFGLNFLAMPRGTFDWRLSRAAFRAGGAMLKAAPPTLFAAALPQLRFLVAAAAASSITGGIAALFYATRLVELPLGLIGASAGAVLLPALAAEESRQGHELGTRGIEAALALALPAALGLAVLAHPIVTVLFERGAFDRQASALTATALALLALSLPLQAVEKILAAIAFSRGFARLVTKAGLAALLAGGAAGFAGAAMLGMAGPALGVLVSSLVGLGTLGLGLARRGHLALSRPARRRIGGLVAAALVMAGAIALALTFTGGAFATNGLGAAGALAGLVLIGMIVYGGAARAFGAIEFTRLTAALRH